MLDTYDSLPGFLKGYCALQSYECYTPQDQAVWRFALRQLSAFLSEHAVPVYREGLKKTGITLEEVPRIQDMSEALSQFGWGAIAVEGFIPPKIFLEFQARRILPIAVDIRQYDHLSYTPAPDIIHEAAGHAPIIADQEYADYLTRYAELAQKAIFSDHDIRLYEAIRYLSDVKELRGVAQETIATAQASLDQVVAEKAEVSEAGKVARLYWWTAEYGLLGSISAPKLYGAGLLSSVMESKDCLSPTVKKIPLSIAAVDTPYDITEPQPQLFVARDYADLHHTLSEVEKTMAFNIGGQEGLRRAQKSATVTTCQLDSGLQISGCLTHFTPVGKRDVSFLRFSGRCQFSMNYRQLIAQGCDRHPEGCMFPLGRWENVAEKDPWLLTADDLFQLGIRVGHRTRLNLQGGYSIEGVVLRWYYQNGRLLYVTWGDYTLRKGANVLHSFTVDEFDMPVGSRVVSVFGGPAAREEFGAYAIGEASTQPRGMAEFSERDQKLFAFYAAVKDLRVSGSKTDALTLATQAETLLTTFPDQWLLALELIEVAGKNGITSAPWLTKLQEMAISTADKDMITKGLELYQAG